MAGYKQKVISLTKRPGQTFGFYLRVEHNEDGHLVRCLDKGGSAQLAGMKDGDRIIRVNGKFTDELSHLEVVDLVKNSGLTVAFHVMDEASYKQAKSQGVNLSKPQTAPAVNGVTKPALKPKLCHLVKNSSGFGFSLSSVRNVPGLFMSDVASGGVAAKAGVKDHDRLVELNGDNVEECTHEQVVDKIKMSGSDITFLLVDEETDKDYKNKRGKIQAHQATTKYLNPDPRVIKITRGADGYGFLLREEPDHTGHFINDIDRGSPAERAGLKKKDRLVAVEGQEVDSCSHEQVVDMIRLCGNQCCLLVVDNETDHIYKQANVSPLIYWEEMNNSNSPPSYTEAITTPVAMRPATSAQEKKKELKLKLCRLEKTSAGFGFRLNGVQGLYGQHIKEVVKGGAADRAGMEDDDVVVEVDGVNVEQSTHEEVVDLIHSSGNSLEMLVARKSVYDELKANGVAITRLLLDQSSSGQAPTEGSSYREEQRRHVQDRPETPTEQVRERASSVSSSSSEESLDERL